ncbi:fluoride efflux transporter CrcB [Pseudalkalibacillus decolorationis]|uniref:fluoride efflux transporter CrcB n=1 Tax=Pseudalkalibacillus decolorationis TaxID=163879 RepID=UPI0021499328|nr:fluoride efflux transporter CrcB [Pseudalkalibacillus decolorationis]
MLNVLLVMVGGFVGAICRFSIGEWISVVEGFPIGTLSVNLAGCFVLGWFLTMVRLRKRKMAGVTLLIGTGFIGSFTTFSTFSVETIKLFQDGNFLIALIYILVSVFVGLLFTFFGYKLASTFGKTDEGETI